LEGTLSSSWLGSWVARIIRRSITARYTAFWWKSTASGPSGGTRPDPDGWFGRLGADGSQPTGFVRIARYCQLGEILGEQFQASLQESCSPVVGCPPSPVIPVLDSGEKKSPSPLPHLSSPKLLLSISWWGAYGGGTVQPYRQHTGQGKGVL